MIDTIEGPLNEMIEIVKSLAPLNAPAIFPTHLRISDLNDFCTNKLQREQLGNFLTESTLPIQSPSFVTKIDYRKRIITISDIKVCLKIYS
jgi:hypothetical protein